MRSPLSFSALRAIACAAVSACYPVQGGAQVEPPEPRPLYDVEVVMFAHASPNAGGEELWPEGIRVPNLDGVLELLPPPRRRESARQPDPRSEWVDDRASKLLNTTSLAPSISDAPDVAGVMATEVEAALHAQFQLLGPADYRLTEQAARINRSSRYRLLWHAAWRQPGLPAEQAIPILVRAGDPAELPLIDLTRNLDLEALLGYRTLLEAPGPFEVSGLLDRAAGVSLPARLLLPPEPSTIRIYPLNGSLRLEMGRYLHLYTDLVLTEPVAILPRPRRGPIRIGGTGAQALQSFAVRSHRRMRSGEVHHVDHPLVGILVLASRVEIIEPPAEKPNDASAGTAEPPSDLPQSGQ